MGTIPLDGALVRRGKRSKYTWSNLERRNGRASGRYSAGLTRVTLRTGEELEQPKKKLTRKINGALRLAQHFSGGSLLQLLGTRALLQVFPLKARLNEIQRNPMKSFFRFLFAFLLQISFRFSFQICQSRTWNSWGFRARKAGQRSRKLILLLLRI